MRTLPSATCLLLVVLGEFAGADAAETTPRPDVQSVLERAAAGGEFSGVVLAARGDEIIFRGAVGQANRSWKIPNALTTQFRICSITKQFTALLVMQLVEAGKIKLDGTLAEYLPDFRPETAKAVTIRHLLMNASGLPDLPDEVYVNEEAHAADAKFVIAKYLQGDLAFVPGSKFNYTNSDFIILGEVVARVSGLSYEQNLREKILEPLGMKNTGLLKSESIVPEMAEGYTFRDGQYGREGFVQIQNFGAAGAMYSCAGDLLAWDKALLTNKLVSKETTATMYKAAPELGYVACGSWSYPLTLGGTKRVVVERQGHINGFSALNLLIPEDGLALIFLGNVDTQTLFQTYTGKGLSAEVLRVLYGKAP